MKLARKIFVATLLTGAVAMADLGAAQVGDSSPVWKTMRPLYAVSFDAGRKHVLSYFLSKTGLCDLTVMITDRLSEDPDDEIIPTLDTARFTAAIDGGTIARIDTAEGKAFEYACSTDAQTMSIREVNQVAVTSPPAR